jgi:hypothetical protein
MQRLVVQIAMLLNYLSGKTQRWKDYGSHVLLGHSQSVAKSANSVEN